MTADRGVTFVIDALGKMDHSYESRDSSATESQS